MRNAPGMEHTRARYAAPIAAGNAATRIGSPQ